MDEVVILGRATPVTFLIGDGGDELDRARLLEGLKAAAELIDSVDDWSDDEREAFGALRGVVFFSGEIEVNGWRLSRPGCDEDDGVFYWEAEEFLANTDADVRANTLFHDCWHIVQFQREGGFARDADERLRREVDAIGRQIDVARKLGCVEREIAHLQAYLDQHPMIVARLQEGVDRMSHAQPILRA